ncbi:MAG: FAD:protein FMN transferase [Acidimicrobiia bacterium]
MAAERRFRAMGSDAHVIVVVGGGAAETDENPLHDLAVARIEYHESRWSRFREDSEICELNRRPGESVAVSDDTLVLVERAVEAHGLSGGSFDPTVLGAVVRSGYDRTFDEIAAVATVPCEISMLGVGASDIEIGEGRVRLPSGTGFDPGGIGKGLAADIVAEELRAAGASGVCVNLGGDVRVSGPGPDGHGWIIDVDHPWHDEPIARLALSEGAVATSTTLKRRWKSDDGTCRHHLIDPATGLPSDSDVNLVTVVAAGAWVAEVLAKAVLLRGSAHPFDLIGGTGAAALVVGDDGRIQQSDQFDRFAVSFVSCD